MKRLYFSYSAYFILYSYAYLQPIAYVSTTGWWLVLITMLIWELYIDIDIKCIWHESDDVEVREPLIYIWKIELHDCIF